MVTEPAAPPPSEPPRLRRRWFVNLALLVAVVALVAFYFYHREREKTEAGPALTAIAIQQVTRVQIERPGQPAVVLEKHGDDSRDGGGTTPGMGEVERRMEQAPRARSGTRADDWRLMAPVPARANHYAVENLLAVAGAHTELKLDGSESRQYGLETPQARLRLNDETIEFGALHPFRQQVYVRYRGVVHLIPAMALTAVARTPGHFIDGRLIEPDRRIVGLRLPGFTLALKDGSWQRQPPDKNLASDQLSNFVAQWTNARALAVEPAGNRAALATLQLTLMRAGVSETLALEVLAYKPTFTLRRRDEKLEYHFPQEIGRRLLEIGAD